LNIEELFFNTQEFIFLNENIHCFNFLFKKQVDFKISDQQILSEARKYLNSPIIDSNETPIEMTDKILSFTKSSIEENQSLYNVCKKIKETVDSEFASVWYCTAFYNGIGSIYHFINSDSMVKMKFGKLSVSAYKVYDKVSE
jgi:hypothetical protein